MKTCTVCNESKPATDYYADKRFKAKLKSECKECHKQQCYKWAQKNKDKKAAYQRKCTFGITMEDYNQFLEDQNSVCAICQQKCGSGNRLSVDHCHNSGKVRGLLCGNCNRALGLFKDNKKFLQKAIDYLGELK